MVTGEALVVLRGVPNGQDWEEVKAKNLKTEHDIDLDPRIKVALLTAMLPADLQDYVFQWSDGKSTCEEMRDRIISMAINRVSMSKPIPMEVDAGWKIVKGRGRWRRTRKDINEERTINAVPVESAFRPVGAGEITVDSAAEESACPKMWRKAYPFREPARRLKFMNASGGSMNHYGEKEAKFTTGGRGPVFQVSDVQKPLAAVWRIADKGNLVQFGPNPEDNFIQNVTTKRKIPMIKKGGSYVIEADFVAEEPGFVGRW